MRWLCTFALVTLAALLAPACFDPHFNRPACGPGGECPGGTRCIASICETDMDAGGSDAGMAGDGAGGASPDSTTGEQDAAPVLCFGSFVRICLSALPTTPVTLSDVDLDIDTGTSPLCDSRTTDYCVVAGTSFSIAAGRILHGHGSLPLILVSTTTAAFQLTGDINVSSSHDGIAGTGAAPGSICLAAASPPTPATINSGGFGGSLGGKGGNGEQTDGVAGIAGAAATSFPAALRGGCPGGAGGAGGAGGSGGGAVAIIAASVQVDGKINASGAGGHAGGIVKSGGGGGGSGGMIVLDAPAITGSGSLFANGGGGGGGGALGIAGDEGGESTAATTAAAGAKNAGKDGGSGGDGSATTRPIGGPGVNSQNNGGGGAGGGGAGFIRARGATSLTISPPSISQ